MSDTKAVQAWRLAGHWILGQWDQMSGCWLWQRMYVQIDSYGTTVDRMMRLRTSIDFKPSTVENLKFWKTKMAAAAIFKNEKIAISRQWLDLSPWNLPRWCSLTLLTTPTAAMSMQPICGIMNFSTDSLQRVGCCTSVIFLLLTNFLHNTSHLFMIILPNDYLSIAKFWSVYRHFSKVYLRKFENWAPVVPLVDWLMLLMSHVHFQRHSLYRMTRWPT